MSFIKGRLDKAIALGAAFALMLAAWLALGPAAAFAQAQAETSRAPEANLPFLFAVYIITWAAFFAYAFYASRQRREMQGEIEALKRALEDRERREEDAAALS